MERNLGKGMTEQQKNHDQVRYNTVETRNEGLGSANQKFLHDPSNTINSNMRPPDFNMPVGTRPVLNYSIQTGEEFALEFMRERVNPRQHFVANASGDSAGAIGYMDLKGILGISHTESESSSDISMLTSVDRNRVQEFERKGTPVNEDKGLYESVRSVPRTSSRNDSNRGPHSYTSSRASESSSTKVKFLCSFGGKVLPRPSDGKLRYVGGETRIIRLSRNISWQDLMQKTSTIYSQTYTIKYQLPGEDLDALVSVSCDEDLQNMMEECSGLEDGGSQKLRMFLFSNSEMDDSQFGMGSIEGDSEIQYVVAVNGMDIGSRKDSIGLASTSENNLDELLSLNVGRESSQVAAELAGASIAPVMVNVPSSTIQSTQPVLQSLSNYAPAGENVVQMLLHGNLTREGALAEEQRYGGLHDIETVEANLKRNSSAQKLNESEIRSLDKELSAKESKMKRDASVHEMKEPEAIRSSEKEFTVTPHPVEVSFANSTADMGATLFPFKNNKRHQEPVQTSMPPETLTEGKMNKFNNDDHSHTSGGALIPGYGGCEADLADFSHLEPAVIPQRVFRSERIPREQAELNRLSKSDDSFDPQFFITHARPDISQPITESVDRFHDGNVSLQTEQAKLLKTNPPTVEDGLAPFDKYKELAGNISDEGSELKLQNSAVKHAVLPPVDGHGVSQFKESYNDLPINDKAAAAVNHPMVSKGTSGKDQDDSASRQQEVNWVEIAANKNSGNNSKGHAQTLAWTENPVRAAPQGESSVGVGTPGQGDILIDINDRFPRDFLSDIFSQARISGDLSAIGPLTGDGTGLSLNMENHEPKHWSFFQKLAQDIRKDVSLIDQDPAGFSSPLANIEEEAPLYSFTPLKTDGHMDSHINFDENIHRETSTNVQPNTMDLHSDSQINGNESVQFNVTVKARAPESEYEEGNLMIQNPGAPLVDLSLGDFDISTLQIIKNEDLEELKELGSGTFGTVYHGKWRGTDVAIKRIKNSCFTGRSSEQERLTVEFWREAEILSKLHHPNVVAFYGVVQDGPGGTLATVTEFMVNGSLRRVLLCKDRHLDRRKRLIIAMDAAFGMEYLHSKNIVHFDLKCDNLLVNLKDPLRPICKVGDFGLSKIKRNTLVTGGVRGTLPWMAPELLNGSSSKVSEKVDVFSFGIVLWEILTGEEPYANMHYGAIIGGIVNNTLRPPVPGFCDPEWRLLMEQCWAPDPVARPSFTEIARRLRVMSAASQSKPPGYQAQNQVSK
ncbi:uncharacterized protein LOC131159329 isoform X2 [Malania oleifera]|uniref:uncharacterized protein LOC131159329 isoform X2 n=1 Tax=Malania oleifera TaxID=397392 RepID=UPI0025ADFF24|nr:uncharacterized protein LOC131159329 isoform X2 [Malania oleifera]XP_057970136.1 uncharacterized protein LOC131159329 isoform X2 [Malania oleifera]XP_057970137.1 uncharacterized protein LOC131159329 isoform X2 [Malania oleifera]XP_057970138.1 uncharacterized protein LOC131159329 isoform X2 [Malania oleifera]XP_057970139.1 uncharacterized protein LOC131159329 isoform X2 [Malania oleifera]XP_057970140.1 uncharacterized protein LOC131159329 isoform X2 [Malania oleifera]XP_057970141.1 uncharac